MRIGLKIALIIFVAGIWCLSCGDVWAIERHSTSKCSVRKAAKCVVRKTETKFVAHKSASVHTKNKRVAEVSRVHKGAKVAKSVKGVKGPKVVKNTRAARGTKVAKVTKINKNFSRPVSSEPVHPSALALQSGEALVVEQQTGGVLFQKNANQIAPIASITKLMTAMVVLDSAPTMDAPITITDDDVDYLRGSHSRLHVGSVLARKTALLLALMSSENRAAHALARNYPGGMPAFLTAMNSKARGLGMSNTQFEDPTGLTSNNVSTAIDLAKMVAAAYKYQLIRDFTTTAEATVEVNGQEMAFHNTNPLVRDPAWDVGLSKTGYISEAGRCLVMQAHVAEKPVVIVLLDSAGRMTRVGDANRVKHWMDNIYSSQKQAVVMQKNGRHPS